MSECCDSPDVQTFGPNPLITSPTDVCMTCGEIIKRVEGAGKDADTQTR